mmetsp:Transcript_123274/g.393927  ORF Transcript_123274/g.393927 Transcript_123274/m.393927 type:complete len:108 (-) Transcript_123274:14-337(-)
MCTVESWLLFSMLSSTCLSSAGVSFFLFCFLLFCRAHWFFWRRLMPRLGALSVISESSADVRMFGWSFDSSRILVGTQFAEFEYRKHCSLGQRQSDALYFRLCSMTS